jgi:poly(A) polymerase
MLEALWTPQRMAQPARLVTGNDLIQALRLQPGPIVGQLLEAIREAQFVGTIQTRDDALALAQRVAAERQHTDT